MELNTAELAKDFQSRAQVWLKSDFPRMNNNFWTNVYVCGARTSLYIRLTVRPALPPYVDTDYADAALLGLAPNRVHTLELGSVEVQDPSMRRGGIFKSLVQELKSLVASAIEQAAHTGYVSAVYESVIDERLQEQMLGRGLRHTQLCGVIGAAPTFSETLHYPGREE